MITVDYKLKASNGLEYLNDPCILNPHCRATESIETVYQLRKFHSMRFCLCISFMGTLLTM